MRTLLSALPVGAEAAVSLAWATLDGELQTTTQGCAAYDLFQAGSISKTVAASAILALVDRGGVPLDLPVNDALAHWQLRTPAGVQSAATIRQLLAHTAGVTVHGFPGYPHGASVPSLDNVLEGSGFALNEPVRAIPDRLGTFCYSGGGYCVLQRVLTDLTASPYATVVHASVFEQAGMRSATFTPEDDGLRLVPGWAEGAPIPGGARTYPELAAAGMCCTATDLVRLGLHLIEAILRSDPRKPSVFATEMVRSHSPSYALGLEVLDLPGHGTVLGHAGSNRGFKSMFALDVRAGAAAAIMVNDDRATLPSRAAVLAEALTHAAERAR